MSLYNEDELVAPSWINEIFLKKVLSTYERDETIEIIKYEMSPASMKGDHYASIMFRCKVNYRCGKASSSMQKSLIIKTMPVEEGMKREMLMQSKIYETEIDMYTKTLPAIEKILSECGETAKLAAEVIYHSLEPHKVIILEDLCVAGYDVVRDRYLTEDEIKAVYRKIAKIHAVSFMLGHSEDHEIVTKYQEGILSNSMIFAHGIFANGVSNLIEMLTSYEEFDIYREKIKAMQGQVQKACKDLYCAYQLNHGQGDIFVLNHGDFHLRNLMFKFNNNNEMEDLIMVDYQVSCYAPSTIDLVYSQYMMLSPSLRLKRHQFMQYYFMEFLRVMKRINYQGEMPKYSDFQISGLRYRHFAVFLMSTFVPMIAGFLNRSMDELKETDATKFFESPDIIAMSYRIPTFVEDVRKFLPILLSEGYLD